MDRILVKSSNISTVGYNPTTQVLEVEFKNGGVFSYAGVPSEEATTFITSPVDGSHGKHLAAHIKGKYTSTKIN